MTLKRIYASHITGHSIYSVHIDLIGNAVGYMIHRRKLEVHFVLETLLTHMLLFRLIDFVLQRCKD